MTLPIIYTSALSHKHDTGHGHPESTERIHALEELFQTAPFKDWPKKQSTPADLETILLAHGENYIFSLQDNTPDHGLFYLDGDTVLSPDSYDAALYAAGAVCNAVDDVMAGETTHAFCAVRPPGHHAEPDKAMGFCLMNNIFIGARYAQEKYSVKKIAIVDFDVHHGNGTDTMTRKYNATHPDNPILYISTHGYPLFPMTGDPADNNDTLLNIHLPDACNSAQFREIYERQVFPTLEKFAPDLLMLSAGFDAHKDDPLASAQWETADYAWLAQRLCAHTSAPIISVLEGGYNISALTSSIAAHLQALSARL